MCGLSSQLSNSSSSNTTSINEDRDNLDFSDKYNTQLNPAQEQQYQEWSNKLAEDRGWSPNEITRDYDMRGYWLKYAGAQSNQPNGHFTDEFKKPNHPTFSTESKYSGQDNYIGGKWQENKDGSWAFTPSSTTIKMWGKDKLIKYWDKVEPGNKLNLPDEEV